MQRIIKFRVWDKKFQKMYNWPIDIDAYLNKNGQMSNDLILQQFTGVFDKNKKEIYEGDIFKCERFIQGTKTPLWKPAVIKYYSKKALFGVQLYFQDGEKSFFENFDGVITNKLEVIGNIFQNPELI